MMDMLKATLAYLRARLAEPGTMRSLVWVLLSLAGYQVTDDQVAQWAMLASMALGTTSAALPEGIARKTPRE